MHATFVFCDGEVINEKCEEKWEKIWRKREKIINNDGKFGKLKKLVAAFENQNFSYF